MSWLRSCAYCHATGGSIDFYCESCWGRLWQQIEPTTSLVPGTRCVSQSLWVWRAQDLLIDNFVKKQKCLKLFEARQRVVQKLLSVIERPLPDVVCGVGGGRDETTIDHGWAWAQVLARMIDRPACLLYVANTQDYKGKGRQQRWQERRVAKFYPLLTSKRVWFIDDVITTGTTAHAVWEAVGRPEDYTAIGLVYRSCTTD